MVGTIQDIQTAIDRKRILEEAKQGMRRERIQQVKQQIQRRVRNVRTVTKRTFTPPKNRPGTKVQSAFLRAFGQGQAVKSSRGKKGVGRPRAVFKHISPITGKPIPAQVYNKEMRFVRRQQINLATQRQLAIQQNMARQGITPQMAQKIEMQRQIQARQTPTQPQRVAVMPPNQASRLIPNQMPQAGRVMPPQRGSIWNRQGFIDTEVDILGNRRQVMRMTPESFWN